MLEIVRHNPDNPMDTVDPRLAMKPTKQAIRDLVEESAYSVAHLGLAFRTEKGEPRQTGCHDYQGGTWRAFICAK